MKKIIKFVISGPVGSGKTTLIKTLSQTPVVSTEEISTENLGKKYTTVALDFGQIDLGDYQVHLFGTPGQDRFDFMWEILSEGAFGLILLVASDQPQDFPKARQILEYVTSRNSIPFTIGSTRYDISLNTWQPEDIARYFNVPTNLVTVINATDPDSAKLALKNLLIQIYSPSPHLEYTPKPGEHA